MSGRLAHWIIMAPKKLWSLRKYMANSIVLIIWEFLTTQLLWLSCVSRMAHMPTVSPDGYSSSKLWPSIYKYLGSTYATRRKLDPPDLLLVVVCGWVSGVRLGWLRNLDPQHSWTHSPFYCARRAMWHIHGFVCQLDRNVIDKSNYYKISPQASSNHPIWS